MGAKKRSDLNNNRGIIPLNDNQKEYLNSIKNNPLTIAIGAPGTGKTMLAVSEAVSAYDNGECDRIIISRPAVPSEKLGFLPGTYKEKLDPYLRPIFDALWFFWKPEKVNRMVEIDAIEIAPIAFMKGRTFSRSFIILDEAQDTTINQMRLFLTRLGTDIKCVVTGDPGQSELREKNGLQWAEEKLHYSNIVGTIYFNKNEIVRSDLVKELMKYIEEEEY